MRRMVSTSHSGTSVKLEKEHSAGLCFIALGAASKSSQCQLQFQTRFLDALIHLTFVIVRLNHFPFEKQARCCIKS